MAGATSAGVIIQNGEVAVLPPGFIMASSRSFRIVHQSRLQMARVVDVYAGSCSINIYDSGNWSNEGDQ